MKSFIKYIVYFLLGVAVIMLVQYLIPKPIDWRKTYQTTDKIPYGLYILNQELPDVLAPTKIEKYGQSPYEYYQEELDTVNFAKESWLIIEDKNLDPSSFYKILDAVNKGHDAFLFTDSSISFTPYLLDTLGLHVNLQDIHSVNLTNPHLASSKFTLASTGNTLAVEDSTQLEVLGFANKKSVNFIRKKIGDGYLYLGTNAVMFTNYHLLESNNHLYTESVLSYIDSDKLIWFDKNVEIAKTNHNIMRVILGNQSLRWAWYVLLIGAILFVFFNSKRKQRIIPIIKPKENQTVEFAKTIANLYYLEKNHNDLIHKMIMYFLEHVRSEWRIDTQKLDDNFIKHLSQKTNSTIDEVTYLAQLIEYHQNNTQQATEQDVNKMHAAIEKIIEQ